MALGVATGDVVGEGFAFVGENGGDGGGWLSG